jgi:hypothetical protein
VRLRLVATLLFAAGPLLYLGLALPLSTQTAVAQSTWARLRGEREALRAKLRTARAQAAGLPQSRAGRGSPGTGPVDTEHSLRGALAEVGSSAKVHDLRFQIHPGRRGAFLEFQLEARGLLPDLLRLADGLAQPTRGLLLDQVVLVRAEDATLLQAKGAGHGERP